MKRPALFLAAAALVVPLVPGMATETRAATEVRHYLDADQYGTATYEGAADVDGGGALIASAGSTLDTSHDPPHEGDWGAYVRVVSRDLDEQWTDTFGTEELDFASAVATDGRSVVTGGTTYGSLAGTRSDIYGDAWIRLYDRHGDETWTRQFGADDELDSVADVEASADGVYASGWEGDHAFVRKYSLDGSLLWEGQVAGLRASEMVLRGDRLYVALEHEGSLADPDRATIAALDTATGARKWQTRLTGRYYRVVDLVTDGASRLYLVGVANGNTTVFGFDFSGERTLHFNHYLDAEAAAWDGSSLIVQSWVFGDNRDLVAFSPTGRERWRVPMPDDLTSVAIDYHPAGNFEPAALYAAGGTDGSLAGPQAGDGDAVIARFVTYQPDARVSTTNRTIGNDRYGARHQRLILEIPRGRTAAIWTEAQNDGEVEQELVLKGCRTHDGYRIRFVNGSEDVTPTVTGSGYTIHELPPRSAGLIRMKITALGGAARRATCAITVTSPTTDEVDRVTLWFRRP